MKAQQHPHEPAGLTALRAYDILDTPRESDFDDIVMLASRICGTPISVINLIDEKRQWFKAEIGLGVRETPLDTSICAHVILEDDFVEIPDTLADVRMVDNPLCLSDPGLRFYAGALLKSKGGLPIGTLCVLDNEPRVLDELQRDALRVLADQVMTQIELRAVIANEAVIRSEIDHRVKNSLQVVSAFVSLERSASNNHEARDTLDRVTKQINVVAALHEHLRNAATGDIIELEPYLDKIVSLINSTLAADVSVQGSFGNAIIRPQEASTVGTIVNELATNALKHSFRNASGTVLLRGKRTSASGYEIDCTDNGPVKKASAVESDGRIGLGLMILAASVQQLDGTMTVTDDENGYATRIGLRLSDVQL